MAEASIGAKSMELFLIRHAASTRAKEGIWGRLYDAPLDRGFEAQLAPTRLALRDIRPFRVLSSPLLRCLETAAFLFPGSPIETVDEFRAYHSGDLENKTEQFVRDQHPEYIRLTYGERFLRPKFQEESVKAQARRVARGLLKVLHGDQPRTAVVGHFSSLNIIAHMAARNWEQETYADGTYDISLGGYVRIAVNPVAVVKDVKEHLNLQW